MKDPVPANIINGIRISVVDLQEKLTKTDKSGKKEETVKVEKTENKSEAKKSVISSENLSLFVAECVGTALLLFLGCMGCITDYENGPVPHYMPALSFGLTVMIIIQMFGHISGAHLNPAVTIVSLILGILDYTAVPAYFLGQFVGAIIGYGGLTVLVPSEYVASEVFNVATNTTTKRLGFCVTMPHPKVSTVQALVIEIVITAVLILICCAVWDKRNQHNQDSLPLRFGLVISVVAIAAGPLSGGSMNTARSFAPALLSGEWNNQWIYWIGPTAGALVGVYFYKALFSLPREPEEATADEMCELKSVEN